MRAKILNTIPVSGSVEEKHFDAVSDCTWVMFQDSQYIDWAGVFGNGWGGGTVAYVGSGCNAFILSDGQGYIVNIDSRKLIHQTGCDYLKSVIPLPGENSFLATDDLRLYLYVNDKLDYSTDRIALDGIEFLGVKAGIVIGNLWGLNEWHQFEFDVSKRHLESSWVYDLG